MSFSPDTVLLDYQAKLQADESEVRIVEKSRRVGVSWGEASEAALTSCLKKVDGGMNTFYIGYNQDMARDFINDVAMWSKNFAEFSDIDPEIHEVIFRDQNRVKDGDSWKEIEKDILVYEIRYASGFRVQALSSRPSNLRGKQGFIIIDEAAFHQDLAELIKAAMAMLIWGGKVLIISTHDGEDNPFNELILDSRAGKTPYSVHRITFKDALNDGLYKRICQRKGTEWTQSAENKWKNDLYEYYGEDAQEELDVVPSGGSGSWLPRPLIEKAFDASSPVIRYRQQNEFTLLPKEIRERETLNWCIEHLQPELDKLDKNQSHYLGEDFARSGDLTAICIGAETTGLVLKTAFIAELRNIPFEQQKQVLFYILDRVPLLRAGAMDGRGNGEYLAEVTQQKYGQRVEKVMLSESWYRENMPRVKTYFEDSNITIPKDSDVLTDLRSVKMVRGIAKVPEGAKSRGSDGLDRHGDSAIALALMTYSTLIDVEEYDYHKIGITAISKEDRYDRDDFCLTNPDWRDERW